MCGIIGYLGYRNAKDVVIDCLKRLEYRGYDSAGIGIMDDKLRVFKEVGEIKKLEEGLPDINGNIGIGHTRWATHGAVTQKNAHPLLSCDRKFAIVHNGLIENFKEIREELEGKGHKFESETDSEIIAHLIEENYDGDLYKAVLNSVKKIKGSFAILVLSEYEPNKIIGVRNESPLVIGIGDNENFIASDVPAFLKYTNRVKYLNDGEICILTDKYIKIMDLDGNLIEREEKLIEWSIEDAEKSGYPHFMLKEIYEQPNSIAETIRGRLYEEYPWIDLDIDLNVDEINEITMVACGTSYYAAMAGKYIMEKITKVPVNIEISSEYRYFGEKRGLVIAITQSGETADTIGALRKAKRYGLKTIAITNVNGSTITKIADYTVLTRAGPEIGVAATKTFTTQLITIFLIALFISIKRGMISLNEIKNYISSIHRLPAIIEKVLEDSEKIEEISKWLKDFSNMFFIGRGINYPLALEGALKMKEISYIHAEGAAAGELKHGPFALLTENTPVIAIITKDETYEKMFFNIEEVKARGSPVVAIAEEEDDKIDKYADYVIRFPSVSNFISSIPIAVILQLLAYHVANYLNRPIDKPRNLAKSVTVE